MERSSVQCSIFRAQFRRSTTAQRTQALVNKTIVEEAFEEGFNLIGEVAGDKAIGAPLPSGTSKKDFLQWVTELPEREPPTYLGLPADAEELLLAAQAKEMLRNLKMVMTALDEGEHVMAEAVEV